MKASAPFLLAAHTRDRILHFREGKQKKALLIHRLRGRPGNTHLDQQLSEWASQPKTPLQRALPTPITSTQERLATLEDELEHVA